MMQLEEKKAARQSLAWLGQAVSGVLLVVIVLLHMYFHHFQVGLLSSKEVVAHVSGNIIFALEILFIIVVTYHALLGMRAIIFDLKLSDVARQKITVGLTILGALTMIYGVILAILIRTQSFT